MADVQFSPSGRDALSTLSSEAQNALLDELEVVGDDPSEALQTDYGYREYYFLFETSEMEYLAVVEWSRAQSTIEVTNVGTADSFYLGD